MVTNNLIDPKCYQITKIMEMYPEGVIKLSLKQDDFNEVRDNRELKICDYYTEEGNSKIDVDTSSPSGTSTITWQTVNENGELEELTDDTKKHFTIGKTSYLAATFSDEGVDPEWRITIVGDYERDDVDYYVGLINMTEFDDGVIAIKPAKANSLSGKIFRLSVSDVSGNYYSSIDVEVT